MNEKINSYCTICGNGYHLCISCKDKIKLSPWKIYTDTAEHYKIHQILHGLSCKIYTKDEARDRLKNVDLSDLNTFKPSIKSVIEGILKEDSVVKVIESEKANTVETTIIEDNTAIDEIKTVYSRRRNFKTNNEDEKVEE